MLRHVAIGYSVHLKRVLWYATWWVSPLVVPGYSDHTLEGYEKRTFIFGVCELSDRLSPSTPCGTKRPQRIVEMPPDSTKA